MTPEEYAALQAVITTQAVTYVGGFGKLFLPAYLSPKDWLGFLELLWPAVKQYRDESASLARRFYDLQRDLYHPTVDNLARELEPYEFQWFVEDMEPVRKVMSQEEATPDALEMVQLTVARAVENGGRRQIIHAVEADVLLDDVPQPPEPEFVNVTVTLSASTASAVADSNTLTVESAAEYIRRREAEEALDRRSTARTAEAMAVRGWARVATGNETCAWCLMLVSRGPVYKSARSAGLDLDDDNAVVANDAEINDVMNAWHPGCDCKVVPVFSDKSWVGKDAAKRALDIWIKAGKKATAELKSNPDKKYYSVKERRWKKTTDNRETINQLRQMIDAGEINSSDWAALQVA